MGIKPVLALIILSSESAQNGLLALLTTIPQIGAVLVAENISVALRMFRDHSPTLILLDGDLSEAEDFARQVKSERSQTRCIFLVDNVEQLNDVEVADAVLIKGYSAAKLIGTIETLLASCG